MVFGIHAYEPLTTLVIVAHAECRPAAESVYASVDEGTSDEVNAYLAAFRKTVDGINQYWLHGLNDAREIEDWLHDGAEMMVCMRGVWWLAA